MDRKENNIQDKITSLINKIGLDLWDRREELKLKRVEDKNAIVHEKYFVYSFTEQIEWSEIEEDSVCSIPKIITKTGTSSVSIYLCPTFIMEVELPDDYIKGVHTVHNIAVGYSNRKEVYDIVHEYEAWNFSDAASILCDFMAIEGTIDSYLENN